MNAIRLSISSIKVNKFFPRDGTVEFIVNFDDGSEKEITKSFIINEPDKDAKSLIEDIKKVAFSVFNKFDGRNVLESEIKLYFANESEINQNLSTFLRNIKTKVESVRNKKSSEGYIDMIKAVNSMKLFF